MTHRIMVTRDTITATWHNVNLARDKFLIFLKIFKK